jgi:glycopeptide antibiotics resistance protein
MGWLLIALTIVFSLMPASLRIIDFKHIDKFEHLLVYTILVLWFSQIFQRRLHLRLALGFIAMGVGLELLQRLSAFRSFQYSDIIANISGVSFGLLLAKTRMSNCLTEIKNKFL